MRRTVLASIVLISLAAGCNGDEERSPSDTVEAFYEAVGRGDGAAACDLVTDRYVRQVEYDNPSCESVLGSGEGFGAGAEDAPITRVEESEATAIVTVRVPLKGQVRDLHNCLERHEGAWLIDVIDPRRNPRPAPCEGPGLSSADALSSPHQAKGQAASSTDRPPMGSPAFPAAVYPPPVKLERRGAVRACPNPRGVQTLDPNARAGAVRALRSFSGDQEHDKRYADRAFWQDLRLNKHLKPFAPMGRMDGRPAPTGVRYSSGPSRPYSGPPGAPCSPRVVRRTWAITLGPVRGPLRRSASIPITYYLLQRQNHWLVWYWY